MSSLAWRSHRVANADVAAYLVLSEQQWPNHPPPPIDPKWWRTPFAWITGHDENGEVVGGCEWIRRVIRVGDEEHTIAALGGVVMAPDSRGSGLGGSLVNFAAHFAADEGYEWALLFTSQDRRSFYERLGYSKLGGNILVTEFDVQKPVDMEAVVMAKALTHDVIHQWPHWKTATIDVGIGTW